MLNKESYRQQIYHHYLGQSVDPETFIQSRDLHQICTRSRLSDLRLLYAERK